MRAAGVDRTRLRYRWVMLVGVWGVYAGFGLIVGSVAPVIEPISDDLGLDRSSMGVVLASWQLVYLASAVPCGRLIDRLGLRRSLALAAVLIGVSGFLRALAVDFWTLAAGVAVLGVGGPLISIGAPKLISIWFDEHDRRRAVGVYTTAPTLGVFVAVFSANSVLMPATGGSWRITIAVFAALATASGVVWAVVAGRAPVPEASPGPTSAEPTLTNAALLALPVMQVVLVLAVGTFFFAHALSNWLVEMLKDTGLSAADAGVLAAVTTLVGAVGNLVVPGLATVERRAAIMTVAYLAAALTVVGVVTASGVLLVGTLVVVGVARSATMPLAMLFLMDDRRVGPANMAAAGGLFFTAGEVGGVLGPMVTGIVAQSSGGFGVPVALLSVTSAAMAGLAVVLHTVFESTEAGADR